MATVSGFIKSRINNSTQKLPLGNALVQLYGGLTGKTNPIGDPILTPSTGAFSFTVSDNVQRHVRVRYASVNGGPLIEKMIEMDGIGINLDLDHEVLQGNANEVIVRKDW